MVNKQYLTGAILSMVVHEHEPRQLFQLYWNSIYMLVTLFQLIISAGNAQYYTSPQL